MYFYYLYKENIMVKIHNGFPSKPTSQPNTILTIKINHILHSNLHPIVFVLIDVSQPPTNKFDKSSYLSSVLFLNY